MTTATLLTNTTITNIARGKILPVRDYLLGSYVLGGSKAETVKNRANPSVPLVEVGVITALAITASGSGGTDGTYNLIFSGAPTVAAAGTFTVSGGAVTAVNLTANGQGYTSTPTVSLTNCPGLTGATVTATRPSPTYNANSVIVKSSVSAGFGFQTQITSGEDFTWILIRKNCTLAAQPTVMGMAPGGSNSLWGFREFGGNNFGSGAESSALGTTGSAFRTKPAAGTVYFEAITHAPLAYTQYYYGAGNVLNLAPNAAAGVATGRRSYGTTALPVYSQLLIGGGGLPDSVTNNTCEAFFAAQYNRVLSAAELAQDYAALQAYYAALGITVA